MNGTQKELDTKTVAQMDVSKFSNMQWNVLLMEALGGNKTARRFVEENSWALQLMGRSMQKLPVSEGPKPILKGEGVEDSQVGFSIQRIQESFELRGLPNIEPQWLENLSGQTKRSDDQIKKDLTNFERLILDGNVDAVKDLLKRNPMVPWLMDFSLREYEYENLILFTAKYAPPGADKKLCEHFGAMGIQLPQRSGVYSLGRLDTPSILLQVEGQKIQKSVSNMMECLLESGWRPQRIDLVYLLRSGIDEGQETVQLNQKIEIIRYLRGNYYVGQSDMDKVSDAIHISVASPKNSPQFLAYIELKNKQTPGSVLSALSDPESVFYKSMRDYRNSSREVPDNWGAEEALGIVGAPYRTDASLALLFEELANWGIDFAYLSDLASLSGLVHTARVAKSFAERVELRDAVSLARTDSAQVLKDSDSTHRI